MKFWLRRSAVAVVVLGVPALIVWHNQVWAWVEIHTGTVNESGPYYGFWSGFGSDLGEYVLVAGLFQGLYLHWSHINCHEPGCWWVGKYRAASGDFHYCHRHHPDFGGKPPTREHIHRRHREHLARQQRQETPP